MKIESVSRNTINKGEINILEISFTKKQLQEALSKEECRLFILIGNILNEIYMLHKISIYNKNLPNNCSGLEETAKSMMQHIFFLELLTGKLVIAKQALDKYLFGDEILSKEYNKNAELKWRKVKKDIEKLRRIRNKVVFHYDFNIIKSIDEIEDDENLSIYIDAEHHGNCFYYACFLIKYISLLQLINSNDKVNRNNKEKLIEEAIKKFHDTVYDTAKIFIELLISCIDIFVQKLKKLDIQEKMHNIQNIPSVEEVFIPFISIK